MFRKQNPSFKYFNVVNLFQCVYSRHTVFNSNNITHADKLFEGSQRQTRMPKYVLNVGFIMYIESNTSYYARDMKQLRLHLMMMSHI